YQDRLPLQALIVLLMTALDEGSLCLEEEETNFRRRLETLLEPEDARWWAALLSEDLRTNGHERLIGPDDGAGTPLVRQTIGGRSFLFFQKYLRHEQRFLAAIQQRLVPGLTLPADAAAARVESAVRQVLVDKPLRPGGVPLKLDDDQ